jgi:hypothetical protein
MATDYTLLRPARTLAEMGDTLLKQPLETQEEFDAFYSDQYSTARGVDRISHLGVELGRSFRKAPFHGFVMGHPGVGKSTEISRLLLGKGQQFRPIRISAKEELRPGDFRIYDLLWLMILRVLTETKSPVISGFSDKLSSGLLEDVRKEMSQRLVKILGISDKELEGGLDFKLFAKIRATLKISRQRTEEVIEYTYSALSELLDVVNRVFIECNGVLQSEKGQEWILVVEDFEKLGVEAEPLRRMFFDYRSLFEQLKCHLLFVIPVGLAYTEDAEKMPFGPQRQFMIPDIAVSTNMDHLPDEQGLGALMDVIDRRVEAVLLDKALARSMAIASGGNLRDLFDLLGRAGIAAEARQATRIERRDALEAVQWLRSTYRFRLGESDYGAPDAIPIQTKMDKLAGVYRGIPSAQIPDKTLYVLLRNRMVLQYNGNVWFGVHPLVVDLLKEAGSIGPDEAGGTDLRGK